MKQLIVALGIMLCAKTQAQDVYHYYFLQIRPTGTANVEVAPEGQAYYEDIAALVETKREKRRNGTFNVTGKVYESYSAAFNALSQSGLEFVQLASLASVGGLTSAALKTSLTLDYMIWRKKIK